MIESDSNFLIFLILILPLCGFVFLFTFGKHFDSVKLPGDVPLSGFIACTTIAGSFLLSLFSFAAISTMDRVFLGFHLTDWIAIESFKVSLSLVFDRLSSVMCLIITGVGLLIHLYSIGYMSEEKKAFRYFSYLNLFCFFMLLLVLSSNVVLLFFGWEGVGLCSFLLIGYWFQDTFRSDAAKKAFITNRVGDLFFLLGTFLLFKTFGTFEFSEIKSFIELSTNHSPYASVVPVICIFYFLGATGKSAQIPLHVWLPDAMAGPTPVSALIHAATMVTAGVYLVARLGFLYDMAPFILNIIAYTGAFTALMAALIALTQSDIKKILAYSTVSQLGFMFLALGVGNYSAAVFHLMTHAFFKALLFLGSGSVIHGCGGEQDIYKMGSLKNKMPVTFWTMLVGTAAIAGVPFLSGFFSKDEILYSTIAMNGGSSVLFTIGIISAFLTAVYMTRLMCLTFLGKSRLEKGKSVHESPPHYDSTPDCTCISCDCWRISWPA